MIYIIKLIRSFYSRGFLGDNPCLEMQSKLSLHLAKSAGCSCFSHSDCIILKYLHKLTTFATNQRHPNLCPSLRILKTLV